MGSIPIPTSNNLRCSNLRCPNLRCGQPSEPQPYDRSFVAAQKLSEALGCCPISCVAYGSPAEADSFLSGVAATSGGVFHRASAAALRSALAAILDAACEAKSA
jgi:hypothetical protein